MTQSPTTPREPAEPRAERRRRHRALRALLALGFGLAVGLAAAEGILQLLGVEIRADRLARDPVLGWRNRPGWSCPAFSIDSRGFIGPGFTARKPRGTVRVFCLGGSCTAGDYLPSFSDTYPSQLAAELRRRYPERDFEVINAGVGGYSSFQGRLWLEREILGYEPDVLVIYFGWNDHWPARTGGPDNQVAGSWGERLRAWLAWSKLLQLGIKAYHVVRGRDVLPADAASGSAPRSGRPPRVSPEDYAENLRIMVRLVRDRGGETVLVTAPDYLAMARKGSVPDELAGGPDTVEALVRLHASYNQIVREVAREEAVCLVDGAAGFANADEPAALFWNPPDDFIHPSREGCAQIARGIAACPVFARLAKRT